MLLLLVAGLAWAFTQDDHTETAREDRPADSGASQPAPEEPCEGSYYDSHAHSDEEDAVARYYQNLAEYDIGCAVMLHSLPAAEASGQALLVRDTFSNYPHRLVLFLDVIENDTSDISRAYLEELYRELDGNIQGLGEFAFYRGSLQNTSLLTPGWDTIFKFAADKDLFVMTHLTNNEAEEIETVLKRYPDTKIIDHNSELLRELPRLLKKYPNFYFTLDTAAMLALKQDGGFREVLMYPHGEFSVDEFVRQYDQHQEQLLDQAVTEWLPVIKAAPQRIMWGTDASLLNHHDERVFSRLMDFTQKFSKKIPQQYRDDYLYQNAFDAFGAGSRIEPLTEEELKRAEELDNELFGPESTDEPVDDHAD